MDYNRVALFVRVVRAGSFTGAGLSIGLPKSSISRSVSQLEKDLGVRLLQRTTRKLSLTDAGQAYFDAVQAAVSGLDDADAAVRELGAAPRGRVRIAAPPDSGAMDLAGLIARFARKHPAIRLELSLSSRMVDLVAEGFDLAIRAGRLSDSSLVARRVGVTESAIFAAPAYLRRHGRPKTPADLAAHDWVLYRAHDGRATMRLQGHDGVAQSIEATGALIADELGFCLAAAEAGAGLVLMPIPAAVDSVRNGRLELVLPGFFHAGEPLWVVTPSARYVPARVAVVRDYLVDALTRKIAASTSGCAKAKERLQPRPQAA